MSYYIKKVTLKNNKKIVVAALSGIAVLVSCSTKKDSFASRNMHALATKYNILYNGEVALDKGVADLKTGYKDNFWEILPVERMEIDQKNFMGEQKKNPNFDRAEEKAVKAIQKHGMNIHGRERNYQIDEAHLMLGIARYYEQRFVPALEAFNYVLYKYPTSSQINVVKIWREKTNMRLDNDAIAIVNLRNLLKDIKFKDQVFADANATIAQAFINLKETDSAIAKLKVALDNTKLSEEKARYRFILGQLFEEKKDIDSAKIFYGQVLEMNRKSPKQYAIWAQANIDKNFDPKTGDTIAFLERYAKMFKDRENRPYLDVLNHQMALFYDKQKNVPQARKFYNKSLKANSTDKYLLASNYRNLGNIDFDAALYASAGKYYDSTLALLDPKTREYRQYLKKRENLDDVIKYEKIAFENDSILSVVKMSKDEQMAYYNKLVEKLKADDAKKKELEEKAQKEGINSKDAPTDLKSKMDAKILQNASSKEMARNMNENNAATMTVGSFYFYNPATVQQGKAEFKRKWGDRPYVENWRLNSEIDKANKPKDDKTKDDKTANQKDGFDINAMRYDPQFYIGQLPTKPEEIATLKKDKNFANYQLGIIYKEKFKEYKRAANKLENVLENNPEERLVLPSMYNLYKVYQQINPAKAEEMKNKIISQYPDSRYAQVIQTNDAGELTGTPEDNYEKLFRDFEKGNYRDVLTKTETAISQYAGDEIVPKFELLKAHLTGKLNGLTEYKKALNFVALNYPNSQEGKQTEDFLKNRFPQLEALKFNSANPTNWKIIYYASLDDAKNKPLLDKLNKFIKDRKSETLFISKDIYTTDKDLIVLHGTKSKETAQAIAAVLKEYKDYKVTNPAIVISSENYTVAQIKKNLEEYVAADWINKPIVVENKNVYIPKEETKKELPKIDVKPKTTPTMNTKSNMPPSINGDDPMPKEGVQNGRNSGKIEDISTGTLNSTPKK